MSGDLDAKLRAIVLRHTVVGGYPDTMAIAREAYALDRAERNEPTTLERTVWHGSMHEVESIIMDDWITTAGHAEIDRLLNDEPRMDDDARADLMHDVWTACESATGSRPSPDMHDDVTYHWGEGERVAFRRAVGSKRPGHLDPHPGQGSLF